MKALLVLLLLIALGFGTYWWLKQPEPAPLPNTAEFTRAADKVKESIQDKFGKFSLKADDIKQELAKTGRIVREKTRDAGNALADATKDARITAAIKAKYFADPELSALSISVNTTSGVVTLSGFVESHELIAKAMLAALESDGVNQVISTLQVRTPKTG